MASLLRSRNDLPSSLLGLLLVLPSACGTLPQGRSERPARVIDVQGHRGARGLLPENTLPAFKKALDLGVTTLELDTGISADGVVVVAHDPRISSKLCRLAGSQDEPLLKDLPLDRIRDYDCGSLNPDPKRFPEPHRRNLPGTKIPTLQEVFDLVRNSGNEAVRFNIEIKTHPEKQLSVPLEDFVAAVVGVIRSNGLEGRADLQSFDWRALRRVKEVAPKIRTVALLSESTLRGAGGGPSPWLAGTAFEASGATALGLLEAANTPAHYIDAFSPDWHLILPGNRHFLGSTVAQLQEAGYPVIPWTVNRRREMKKLLALGADGIITDYPDILLELLEHRRER